MSSSTNTFTYWSLLGLSPGSDSNQLKSAFIREARRWHPDLNGQDVNAEERFKWVNEAYKVLSDPTMRFEWERAGRPTVEIQKIPEPAPEAISIPKENQSQNDSLAFSNGEKFLVLVISGFSLLFLNAFIL